MFEVGGPNAVYEFDLGNGENFLTITAIHGQLMTDVAISSATDILDGRQFRIGGIQPIPVDVPEPASLAMFGAGLFAIAGLRRKRRTTQ